ncbi:MAG: HipA domain-containing protein [Acidimicrobiaceae bacterium]|nr:HipA domain-containing protein [Acidimicrobiaceae bacterium]
MKSELLVFMHGEPIGRVVEGRERACWFSYLPEYTEQRNRVPLSLTVPIGTSRYDISHWMDGLLPNRLDVREHCMRSYGARSTLAMDMLATLMGWDCAGAVQFCPEDAASEMLARRPRTEPLGETELARHLESVRRNMPDLLGAPQWVPFSLAGAQAKTALIHDASGWAKPTGGHPSTHILKIALSNFEDNDLVEYVCMTALRLCGVAAPRVEIVQAEGERAIAVERFDRIVDAEGRTSRVHQEDVCQALGFESRDKYQASFGPSPVDIAELLDGASTKQASKALFRDALVCNWLLAAPDAHAKNYSLLMGREGYSLAPLYDVCSSAPYHQPVDQITMAMKVGDAWGVEEAGDAAAWIACAQDLGLDAEETLARVEELSEMMPAALTAAVDSLPENCADSPMVVSLVDSLVRERLGHLPQRWIRSRDSELLRDGLRALASGTRRERTRTRCPHYGKRTGRRCNRTFRHRGPHRYR